MKKRSIGIVISYLNTGLNMVCGLFLSSYLLRILGDTEYGIYQTIASFANYLILLEFGTGTVMTRNISMCRGRNASRQEIQRNVNTIWMLACGLAVVILAVAVVFYLNIGSIYAATLTGDQIAHAKEIFIFVIIHLLGSFLNQTLSGVVLAHENYLYGASLAIGRTVLRTVLLVVLLLLRRSALIIAQVDAAVTALMLATTMAFLYKKHQIVPKFGRLDRLVLRTAAPLALALFLQTVVNQANNNVDKFLIGIMLSPESVSLYSVGMYVFSIFSSLTTIPISMYAPAVAKQVQQQVSMQKLQASLVPPCRLTAIIGGLIYFGFIAMGRPFVELVYGAGYTKAWIIAIVVMTPMYINMINGVLVNVLDALNKRMIRSVALICTTVANILLTILWLRWWGEIGAALATALCTLIGQVLFMNIYYSRKLKIGVMYLFREALSWILLWFILGCAAALLVGALIDNVILTLIVRSVVFIGIVGGGYLIKGIREPERQALKKLLRRG